MKPTERQIKFAEAIAEELGLELPEFDKREYSEFIADNKDAYYESIRQVKEGEMERIEILGNQQSLY